MDGHVLIRAGLALLLLAAALLASGCGLGEPLFEVLDGNYRYSIGDYTEATVRYLKALESGKYPEYLYYNLGNVYNALGEIDPAVDELNMAAVTKERELGYRTNFNLGNLQFELGAYKKAVLHFKAALKAKPKDIDAKVNLELAVRKMEQEESVSKSQVPDEGKRSDAVEPFTQDILKNAREKETGLWKSLRDQRQKDQQKQNDW
jgi:Ca-activated chloride channel homolog